MTLLAVENLSISFTNEDREFTAVKNVSFNIGEGEVVALVGESGSGKSVSALSILKLLPCPPASIKQGSIKFEGQDILSLPENELMKIRGDKISMIFQEPMTALNPLHTIERQVNEALLIHNSHIKPNEATERTKQLLAEVGLSHLNERLKGYPHQLSGGERQRVMIAMALANKPKLLIADEPTTALDVTVQAQIIKLLEDLQKQHKVSILFISHDLGLVRRFASRVYIMKSGEVVEHGNVNEVFTNPKHEYTRKLVESEPKGRAVPLPEFRSVTSSTPQSPASNPLLEARKLKVYYPIKKGVFRRTVGHVKALEALSFNLHEGETLGVVGESGSGKSSLAYALIKLIRSEGEINFGGKKISLEKNLGRDVRHQIQMVFQDPYSSLSPRMLVRDIVAEGLLVHKEGIRSATFSPRKQGEDLSPPIPNPQSLVTEALQDVGLDPEMANRYPHELSGGQRQRVSIARAIILRPKLLLLDEPTSALDLATQSQILELLKKLQQERGLSYIFISHDLRVIRSISHKIIVLQRGQVMEEGETSQIFDNPKSDYTKRLIDAAFLK